MSATGTSALYRPVPADFDAMFVRLGWSSIEQHYRASSRMIVKWMAIRGRDRLRAERAAYVREHGTQRLHC